MQIHLPLSVQSRVFVLNEICVASRVHDVSLNFAPAQQWHLLGANGAGKSSLLNVLAGLLSPNSGQIQFCGQALASYPLPYLASKRCFLQQQQISAFDIPLNQLLFFYTQQNALPNKLEACFQLNSLLHKTLSMLSGGQQQRFNIARSLLQVWANIEQGNAAIILDEPCQHLDINYQFHFMALVDELVAQGNLLIMSSHDINTSWQHASHVALLKNGKVQHSGNVNATLTLKHLNSVFAHKFEEIVADNPGQNNSLNKQKELITLQKTFVSARNQTPLA